MLSDGANHALEVSRLWQTGHLGQQDALGGLTGQLGGQLAIEAIFALGGGLLSVGLFDAGGAAALLVLVLADATRSLRPTAPGAPLRPPTSAHAERLALFALLAIPIVLHPDIAAAPTARWSATLLQIAALLRLRRARELRRFDGGVLVLAAAMVVLRLELALLATAIVAAALLPRGAAAALLPRGASAATSSSGLPAHRVRLLALAVWAAAVLALQAAMQPELRGGLLAAAALAIALPAGVLIAVPVLRLVGFQPWRDELTAACSGAIATSLLGATGLAGSMQQAIFAAWFGLLVLALTRAFGSIPLEEDASSQHSAATAAAAAPRTLDFLRGPMGLVLAAAVAITVLGPNLHTGRRDRMISRLGRTLGAATELRAIGFDRLGDSGLLELQQRTPAGARVGFWGTHPSGLDFRRNPVRDVSWPKDVRVDSSFLTPLSRDLLREVDFVIVETVQKKLSGGSDPWGATALGATGKAADALELLAQAHSARLYRVRK